MGKSANTDNTAGKFQLINTAIQGRQRSGLRLV
jgi:hypothetical protein